VRIIPAQMCEATEAGMAQSFVAFRAAALSLAVYRFESRAL